MATLTVVSGVPGVGKTLQEVRRLIAVLKNDSEYRVITNIHLNLPAIAAECKIDNIYERILLCDMHDWLKDGCGPWSEALHDCELLIDEFHNYCPRTGQVENRKRWVRWIKEARHANVTVRCLTQDIEGIDKDFVKIVEKLEFLVNVGSYRLPFVSVDVADLFLLWWSITGNNVVFLRRCIASRGIRGLKLGVGEFERMEPKFFQFYDTLSRPVTEKTGKNRSVSVKKPSVSFACMNLVRHNSKRVIRAFVIASLIAYGIYNSPSYFSSFLENTISYMIEKNTEKNKGEGVSRVAHAGVADVKKPSVSIENGLISGDFPLYLFFRVLIEYGYSVEYSGIDASEILSGSYEYSEKALFRYLRGRFRMKKVGCRVYFFGEYTAKHENFINRMSSSISSAL